MQAKPKSNSVITTKPLPDGRIEFTILRAGPADEHGLPTNRVLVLDPDRCSPDNRARAMLHGFVQRIVDKAALPRDPKTFKPASASDKADAMAELIEHYHTGSAEWSPTRQRVVRVDKLDSLLVAAVAEGTGRTEGEIVELVGKGAEKSGVTKDVYLAKLASAKLIAPIVERMKAEAAARVEGDPDEMIEAMLAGEGAEDEEGETEEE